MSDRLKIGDTEKWKVSFIHPESTEEKQKRILLGYWNSEDMAKKMRDSHFKQYPIEHWIDKGIVTSEITQDSIDQFEKTGYLF